MSRYALADAAALMGEPTRAAMLLALLDGRALPVGELASVAGLSLPATSLHLAKLTRGGLLVVQRQGRHRYHRLASDEVAHAIEALGVIASKQPSEPSRAPSMRDGTASLLAPLSPEREALRLARSCYDHLAGKLAVALTGKLERERGLRLRTDADREYVLTSRGSTWLLESLGLDVSHLGDGRRPLARRCLDWTERRPHLAGALGAAVLTQLLSMRWVAKTETRALRITTRGAESFAKLGL